MYLVFIIAFVLLLCLLLVALYWIRALKLRIQRLEFDLMLLRKIVRYQGWEARKNALRNSKRFQSLQKEFSKYNSLGHDVRAERRTL